LYFLFTIPYYKFTCSVKPVGIFVLAQHTNTCITSILISYSVLSLVQQNLVTTCTLKYLLLTSVPPLRHSELHLVSLCTISVIPMLCLYTCITASESVFHQLLAALRRRRKSPNLSPWAHQPTSINQATLGSSAHFNQPGNFGLISPLQSTRQHWTTHGLVLVSSTCLNS
jgi:hypothetical protein